MMQDLHTHSVFDDGSDTLEAMLLSALDKQLPSIGLSGHCPLPFASDWSIQPQQLADYIAQARRLQAQYAQQLAVFVGLEFDALCTPVSGFDYLIGSVHYITVNGRIYGADCSPAATRRCIREAFHSDPAAMEQAFYAQYALLAQNDAVSVIGHFDVVTKFDETRRKFGYAPQCALDAMQALVRRGKLFELNTGAICRGYRRTPYPSVQLLRALREMGGGIVFGSDAHRACDVAFGLESAAALARSCGFTEYQKLTKDGFVPCPL